MSSNVSNLLMVCDFDNLKESVELVESLLADFELSKEDCDIILRQSLIYGNYYTYDALNDCFKDDETEKEIVISVSDRILNIVNHYNINRYEDIKEDILVYSNELNDLFLLGKDDKIKKYNSFKELSIVEYLLESNVPSNFLIEFIRSDR